MTVYKIQDRKTGEFKPRMVCSETYTDGGIWASLDAARRHLDSVPPGTDWAIVPFNLAEAK